MSAETVEASAQAVREGIGSASTRQRDTALVGWLNLLASMDLGTRSDKDESSGADLAKAGSGRSWPDLILNRHPRGVIRVTVRGNAPSGDLEIVDAVVSGMDPEGVETLLRTNQSLGELGLNVFVSGLVYANRRQVAAAIEVGVDNAGGLECRFMGAGGKWLESYVFGSDRMLGPEEQGDEDETLAEEGARLLLRDEILGLTPAEIGIRHG